MDPELMARSAENEQLKAENEKLKLKNMKWKYSRARMDSAIKHGNNWSRDAPRCTCLECLRCRRLYPTVVPDAIECRFIPWFEKKLHDCEIIVKHVDSDMFDGDAHLILLRENDWDTFAYGNKWVDMTSSTDPELKKLVNLFNAIELGVFGEAMQDPALLAENEQLKTENEKLKLKNMKWKYSRSRLNSAIKHGNNWSIDAPRCTCLECKRCRRLYPTVVPDATECRFIPWFEKKIHDCGVVVKRVDSDMSSDDAHLILLYRNDWDIFSYGSMWVDMTATTDPELKKLVNLFHAIETGVFGETMQDI